MPRRKPPKPSPGPSQPEHSPTSAKSLAGLAAERKRVTGEVVAEELVLRYEPVINTLPMAARNNRPRNGPAKEDPDEELSMWNQIKKDLEKCSVIQKRSKEVSEKIVAMEERMGKSPSLREIDELQSLYRENVKLAEDESRLLNEEPADLIKNISILSALRTASASEPPRPSQGPKARKPKPQVSAPKLDSMDGAADSPGPSPSATRLKGSSTARSGSVASARGEVGGKEVGVKIEEGSEGAKGAKGPAAEKLDKFFVGAEVAYKQAKVVDGSQWIQCIIIRIYTEAGKKRYEVQDPEPDENGPGQIYRASATSLIAIPSSDAVLPDYPVGKAVLARYPETTTFYRAEVTGGRGVICRLKFEDDQNQEMEVDRRFVLDVGGR